MVTLSNTGTLKAIDLGVIQLGSGTLSGMSGALSGDEFSVQWQGLPSTSGTTYTYEIGTLGEDEQMTWEAIDVGTQTTEGHEFLSDLRRATTYQTRVTATEANGAKTIYEGLRSTTLDQPSQFGQRVLLGYVDEYGNWAIQYDTPQWVAAGSKASAAYDVATRTGYVTNGTVPVEPGGALYLHQQMLDGHVVSSEYTFNPGPYSAAGQNSITMDPSAQQSLSSMYDIWKELFQTERVPDCSCMCLTDYDFGDPSIESSFTSNGTVVTDDPYGSGVLEEWIPTLSQLNVDASGDRTLQVIFTDQNIHSFERSGSGFAPAAGRLDSLTHIDSTYVMTTASGGRYIFNDFTLEDTNLRGKLVSSSDAAGNSNNFTYNCSTGHITEITRSTAGAAHAYDSWLLDYSTPTGQVSTIDQRRWDGSAWVTYKLSEFAWYSDSDDNGSDYDRKMLTIKDGDDNVIEQHYYRYYTSDSSTGYKHGLQYEYDDAGYARLSQYAAANNTTVDDLTESDLVTLATGDTDSALHAYCLNYYEYDAQHRVITHASQKTGCSGSCGGVGTSTFGYYLNASPAEDSASNPNTWYSRTKETLNDGNVNITYYNLTGQVLLKLFWNKVDGVTPSLQGKVWGTFYQYDSSGKVIWTAQPSALDLPLTATTSWTGTGGLQGQLAATLESYSDLLHSVSGNYAYIRDSAGEINITDYYASTTATDTTAGGVAGYVQDHKLKHGETGTAILLESQNYFLRSASGTTIYPVANSSVYANDDGTGARTTSYSYTWISGTVQAQSVITTNPTVSTDHNGSGTATSSTVIADTAGWPIWQKDASGFLTYIAYDDATGAVIKQIVDVDTSRSSDFANLPSGWSTPSGGGLHLITSYVVDAYGRVTKETSPAGRITYTVYNDVTHEVRTYRGWDSATHTTTGPIEITRQDRANGYTETLTSSATPTYDANGVPTGQETINASNIQSLSRSVLNEGGQLHEVDVYTSLSGVTYSTTSIHLGTAGTNYLATTYDYEKRGRLTRTVQPDGTIQVLFFDGQGHVRQIWQGTDDVPTDNWLPDGFTDWRDFRKWVSSNPTAVTGPAGTNMVKVADYQYDNNTIGDGNLTQSTQYPDASTSNVSTMVYDWGNRLVDSKAADGLVTKYTYDNLGQTTKMQTYVDADSDWTIDSGELRNQSESLYDERGQVYQTIQCEVKPSNNYNLQDHLTTNYFYDPCGLLAKTSSPAGLFSKSSYDGAGRLTSSDTSYDTDETAYADALTVSGDTVMEQNRSWYDKDGNVVTQVNYKRKDGDGSTLGALTAANSYASSGVTWYDKANRPIASANIGHESSGDTNHYVFNSSGSLIDTNANGTPDLAEGSALTPNSSDDYIVTQVAYDAAGNAYEQTDNLGRVTRTNRDMAGRTTVVIENYDDGTVTETEASDTDRTTQYHYDSHGRLSIQRALNPKGSGNGVEEQDTKYLYEDGVNAGLLTSTIYPDSSDTDSTGTDQVKLTYDRLGRKATNTDQRGVVHTYAYDPVGRLASDVVSTLPAGVDGSVRRVDYAYQDDGQLSTITTYSATSVGNIVNQVKYTYDGWGSIKTEQSHAGGVTTGTPAITYTYEDGADVNGNALYVRLKKVTYPSGREIHYIYDATDSGSGVSPLGTRLASISENSGGTQNLVAYTYLGMNTIVTESHPQVSGGLNLSYGSAGTYAGWDRFARIVQQLWKNDAGTTVDGYTYTYDRVGNRTAKTNTLNSAFTDTYAYDDLNRLVDANRNGTNLQDWTLDALGNWSGFTDSTTSQTRTHDAANQTTGISGSWIDPTYDATGNMNSGPKAGDETTRLHFVYDAWNRLVAVKADSNGQPGSTIATYAYDGMGRRVGKTVGGDTFHFYYNEQYQTIEVRKNGDADPYEQTVYDVRYADAPVIVYRDTDTDGSDVQSVYVTQDANFNVTGIINGATGAIINRFVYTPYGYRKVYTATWALGTTDVSLGHQGLYLDSESGLYYNRARYLHASMGVFTIRDPIGYADGENAYLYERDNSIGNLDTSGYAATSGPSTQPTEGSFTPIDLGRRDPVPNPGKKTQTSGLTTPHAGPCRVSVTNPKEKGGQIYGTIRLRGWWMTAEYWWSDPASKSHEEHHVAIHKTLFLWIYAWVKQFDEKEMCWEQAVCWANAISMGARYAMDEASARSAEFDAQEYGTIEPDAIAKAQAARKVADREKIEFDKARAACSQPVRAGR